MKKKPPKDSKPKPWRSGSDPKDDYETLDQWLTKDIKNGLD